MSELPIEVAALYVERGGVYWNLPGVDAWDEKRDARRYAGPWPVVAHPPCARWCQLAPLVQYTHGYAIGSDGGCFEAALRAVQTYGGVLEHPAYTRAWRHFGLPRPSTKGGWTTTFDDPGASCYVEQENYGHPARKPTWLYAVGVELAPISMNWRRPRADDPGWYVRTNAGGKAVVRKPHGEQRMRSSNSSRTPVAFRDVLLAMARSATREETPA